MNKTCMRGSQELRIDCVEEESVTALPFYSYLAALQIQTCDYSTAEGDITDR